MDNTETKEEHDAKCRERLRVLIKHGMEDNIKNYIRENPTVEWIDSNIESRETSLVVAITTQRSYGVLAEFLKIQTLDVNQDFPALHCLIRCDLEKFLLIIRHPRFRLNNDCAYIDCTLRNAKTEELQWLIALHGSRLNFEKTDSRAGSRPLLSPLQRIQNVLAGHPAFGTYRDPPIIKWKLHTVDIPTLKNLEALCYLGERDPHNAQWLAKLQLDHEDEKVATLYAMVVFICDGFLKEPTRRDSDAARFFRCARQLPLELQTILCNRAYCLRKKDTIPRAVSEEAFRYLASRAKHP